MPELTIRSHNVSYATAGGGEPVILLHGGGSSGRQWNSLTATIETQSLCYAPDLFGHGASSAWTTKEGSLLADYAAIVEAIDALNGEPFHLVGHSHGGAVAIAYATGNPNTLSSLTLIAPTLMHLLRVSNSPAWPEAEELGSKHIDAYAQLDVPTLLIRGTRTRATAREIISLLHDFLPNSRLVEIEGAGHMAPLTHAFNVNEAIANHLVRHRHSAVIE